MKYFVVILSILLAIQASQAFDLRGCVNDAVAAAEADGKIEGFEEWTVRLNEVLDKYDHTRNELCPNLAQNNPPSLADQVRIQSCRNDALRTLLADIQLLSNDLQELAGATSDAIQQLLRDINGCITRQ